MWFQLFLLVSSAAFIYAADPNIYRNCSETELCSQLRELQRQNRYEVIIEGATFSKGVASFRVEGVDGSNLFLNITAIEGNIFRVQIEEAVSSRYHLENVLDGEPTIIDFDDVQLTLDSASIIVGNRRAYVTTSPLSVEFYTDEMLQLVIEGDRLTLDNNELSHPFTFGVNFPQAARLYGLHEHADNLALRTTAPGGDDPYRVRTMDLTNYELHSTMAMYGAIPALYGHGVNSTSGLFLHNAAELWVETSNNEAYFMADSGAFDLFVLLGPSIKEVVRQYASLTGVAHLPPIWTLGYHQCRWGYADQEDVQTVIADLDNYDFPVDVIWLDIQHTNNMKFFTWNPGNFSTPFEMLKNLSSTHRYLITLSDPHFKVEEGYFVYDEALARDFFIKNPNGTVFEDQCWPGTSAWMDYLNPEARDYYSSLYLYENWNGTTSTLGGIWNDMNEAAIFNEPNEKTFPYDIIHYGGVSNREIHNMYGYLQTMATHKGLVDRDNGTLRPFILTRAHFAGSQRYAAFWTGDNTAEWGFIPISYSMCLSANLLGISFCGADVGGFFGEPTEELLQRFYQAGAWLPFFREHSNIGSERREPYLYPDNVQQVIREAIKTRYAHLPVWYTLFYEHNRNADPVIRPLFYHYPEDADAFDVDDQLLVGSDILVKVVGEAGVESVQTYFPGGEDLLWFSAQLDGVVYQGTGFNEVPVTIDRIPVFYREGSIISTKQTPRPSTTDMKDDGYTLIAILDDVNLSASGTVYIDDNLSFDYQDSLKYNYISLTANATNVVVSYIDNSDSEGFELVIDEVITVSLVKSKSVSSGEYVKKVYSYTADGVQLSSIRFSGKESVTIKLE
ncbi:Gal mutarotas 2 domain containing protein [Asbolus verrucosus]|uniref:Glucosidase II subunit alpha n=1 Tax=Asbolus verrucosus TaxID=1661398 RepID=A0A482W6B9_ASBVE|nr:Gal mutarotas 2 domain containing protein [Asbolus verrucosus]